MKNNMLLALTCTLSFGTATANVHHAEVIVVENTSITNRNFENADFSYQNLNGSDFSKANCNGANFRKADVRHANFEGADLRNADFTGALTDEKMKFDTHTIYDETTIINHDVIPAGVRAANNIKKIAGDTVTKFKNAGEVIKDGAVKVAENTKDFFHTVGEKGKEAKDVVVEKADELAESAKDKVVEITDRAAKRFCKAEKKAADVIANDITDEIQNSVDTLENTDQQVEDNA